MPGQDAIWLQAPPSERLVPEHTHWGNKGGRLARVSDGKGISGWKAQLNHLKVRRQV